MHPEYFESILQIRPKDKDLINFVLNQINKNKINIAKIIELKTGIDLYLGSRRFTLQLGKKLKKSFKGDLLITRKLFKTDRFTSKRVYRVTVLFRLKQIL